MAHSFKKQKQAKEMQERKERIIERSDEEEGASVEVVEDRDSEGNGMLYIVATPIGNMEDVTLRALRILKEVDIVFCEDTRNTRKILSHYDIHSKTESYHARSSSGKTDRIIDLLSQGQKIAYVTDSGTPGISDPSSMLVGIVREQLPDVIIASVPGASALTSAVSIAGMPIDEFVFVGFLPHKKGRETLLKEISVSERPFIFYESPHRILKALQALALHMTVLAGGERKVALGRELTKRFEEMVHLTPSEHLDRMAQDANKTRGEFVVIVSGLKK